MKININKFLLRFTIIILLLVTLVGLSIYYVENYQKNLQYPTTADVVSNYPLGQTVSISGTVFTVERNGFLVGENYNGEMVYYHVISNITVNPGDHITLIGVLGPDHVVDLKKSVVVSYQSYDFVLLRSFLVVPFLVVLFFIYWKFDVKILSFVRRK